MYHYRPGGAGPEREGGTEMMYGTRSGPLLTLMLAACLVLSGCSAGLAAENMMKPPKAAGDGGEIQIAMTERLGEQISLRFPRSGEQRSAVVRADIDADGAEEAVAFYRLAAESSGAHMIVLDQSEKDGWHIVGEDDGGGGEIDRVFFADINGDGIEDIITGWSFYSGASCIIKACSYQGGALLDIPVYQVSETGEQSTAIYTEMVTGDFDRDGTDDILSVFLNKQSQQAVVNLFIHQGSSLTGEYMASACSTELDGSVAQYLKAQTGNITETITGMVLDGCISEGRYCTELVYYNPSTTQLTTPLNDPETRAAMFVRSCNTVSEDINGDGVTELPRDELLPGYEESDSGALYLTEWHCYLSGSSTQELLATFIRREQSCCIVFKDSWRGSVTVRLDSSFDTGRVLYLHEVLPDGSAGREIMRIKAFTSAEWEEESSWEPTDWQGGGLPQYRELCSGDYYTYAVLVSNPFSDEEQYPQYSLDRIRESFRLL